MFKQKTAYEMRISDWSSDVCSSDLTLFGHAMVRTPLKDSAEIDNATARLMTVYELNGPITSSAVRNRCLAYLDGVNGEIEIDIRSMWPSHLSRLRKEALV